jgi:hypothetical protein
MSHDTKEQRKARTLTTIHSRYTTDHYGPRIEKDKGLWHDMVVIKGAKILKYVVTIYRYDILCVETV